MEVHFISVQRSFWSEDWNGYVVVSLEDCPPSIWTLGVSKWIKKSGNVMGNLVNWMRGNPIVQFSDLLTDWWSNSFEGDFHNTFLGIWQSNPECKILKSWKIWVKQGLINNVYVYQIFWNHIKTLRRQNHMTGTNFFVGGHVYYIVIKKMFQIVISTEKCAPEKCPKKWPSQIIYIVAKKRQKNILL